MEIKLQIGHKVYCLCIGYKTGWFEQVSLFAFFVEYYGGTKEVEWAELLWRS